MGTDLREGQETTFYSYQLLQLFQGFVLWVKTLSCVCMFPRVCTFVVMPNLYFPDAAQAGVCGNVEDIKSVA